MSSQIERSFIVGMQEVAEVVFSFGCIGLIILYFMLPIIHVMLSYILLQTMREPMEPLPSNDQAVGARAIE